MITTPAAAPMKATNPTGQEQLSIYGWPTRNYDLDALDARAQVAHPLPAVLIMIRKGHADPLKASGLASVMLRRLFG